MAVIGIKIVQAEDAVKVTKIMRRYEKTPISELLRRISEKEYIWQGSYTDPDDVARIVELYEEFQKNGIEAELFSKEKPAKLQLFKNLIVTYREIAEESARMMELELGE